MDKVVNAVSLAIEKARNEIDKTGSRLSEYAPEVESRIGVMRDSHNCPHYNWQRLFEEMMKRDVPHTVTNITNITFGIYHVRIRHEEDVGASKKTLYAEAKLKGYPITVEGLEPDLKYWIRYSVSAEKRIVEAREGETEASLLKRVASEIRYAKRHERVINRHSFDIADNYRLDMSRVFSEGKYTYEIELELLNPLSYVSSSRDSVRDFVRYSREISRLSRGTSFIYSLPELNVLVMIVNLFDTNADPSKGPPLHHVNRAIFNEVRIVTERDLRYRGIVGGKYKFAARLKTDGQRSFSVISPYGWWFIYPPYIYDLAVPDSFKFVQQGEITVLDGELIPTSSRRDSSVNTYYYEVFDCLVCAGSDVRDFPLTDRCYFAEKYMKELALREDYPDIEYIRVEFGRYVGVDSSNFFDKVNELFSTSSSLPYNTDGLIFVPSNHKYWCSSDYSKASSFNSVDEVPEILKWKSPLHTTIDFQINRKESGDVDLLTVELDVAEDKLLTRRFEETDKLLTRRLEETDKLLTRRFEGTDRYPFNAEKMVDVESLKDVYSGSIVEMRFEGGQFKMVRRRPEKEKPNATHVAISNWNNINSPILQDTLTGGGLELMHKYHSRKVASLYEGHSGTLLDLGSGRGGRISNWSQFGVIICVEIDHNHIEELVRRAKYYERHVVYPGDKRPVKNSYIVVVEASVTDTQAIKEAVDKYADGLVDFVSLNNVGTFLWKDEKTLRDSMRTIATCLSPGGTFSWIMLDGMAVRAILDPTINKDVDASVSGGVLRFSTFTLQYTYTDGQLDSKVIVGFGEERSIVGKEQEEYLTNPSEMYVILDEMTKDSSKFVKKLDEIANDEKFMSNEAISLSNMYRYGKMEREGKRETVTVAVQARPARGRSVFRGRR